LSHHLVEASMVARLRLLYLAEPKPFGAWLVVLVRLGELQPVYKDCMKFGSVSTDGLYTVPDASGTQFLDAADELYNTIGSRCIKMYASPSYATDYPLQSSWSSVPTNLTQLVQTTQYSTVIGMGWDTVVFTTYTFANGITNWWQVDVSQSKLDAEYDEIYNFVVHLLTTYNDSGMTFILQSLENDWNWSEPTYTVNTFTDRKAVDNYAAFFAMRQRAVSDARKATAYTNVKVLNAIEPNRIVDAFTNSNRRRLVRDIAQRLQPDIIAYSAYDSLIDTYSWTANYATWVATYTPLFRQAIQRIKRAFPGVPIYISEHGWPENQAPVGFDIYDMCVVAKDIALDEGCTHIFYWAIFSNEANPSPPPDDRGYWLIEPDGSLSRAGEAYNDFGPEEL